MQKYKNSMSQPNCRQKQLIHLYKLIIELVKRHYLFIFTNYYLINN
jgi:hypothetical protein